MPGSGTTGLSHHVGRKARRNVKKARSHTRKMKHVRAYMGAIGTEGIASSYTSITPQQQPATTATPQTPILPKSKVREWGEAADQRALAQAQF